jgi:hypothetical protein
MNQILYTDGTTEDFLGEPSLSEKQGMVGGYTEHLYLSDGRLLIVNQDGLIHGLPKNEQASIIAKRTVVGNAVLITPIK